MICFRWTGISRLPPSFTSEAAVQRAIERNRAIVKTRAIEVRVRRECVEPLPAANETAITATRSPTVKDVVH